MIYQTEPVTGCVVSGRLVDELWDYSLHNIDTCKRQQQQANNDLLAFAANDGGAKPLTGNLNDMDD